MFTLNVRENSIDFKSQIGNLLKQNLLPEALSLAQEQRRISPLDVEAHVIIGKILIRLGELDKARDVVKKLDQTISGLSFVYARMADIFSEKGLKSDAAICYRKFINLNPISQQAEEIAEKLTFFEKQESEESDADDSGMENIPKPEFITMTLAELYIKQGHLQMAREVLAEIIKREPRNINAIARLGSVKAISKAKAGSPEHDDPDILVDTLSGWLANIDRLSAHAAEK
jgi:tetratricopeptide (TPR) repeat protein